MTLGVDVSGAKAGFNFKQAKQEGLDFALVKAAGLNVKPLYVAGGYREHIDNAHAAGLGGYGHYYLPGQGDVTAQADYFTDHLYRFDVNHDVLALDNEPLDSNKVYWKVNDAYAFLARVQARTKIPWNRLWFYAPAGLTRSNGPWDKITDKGVRVWWSAYGAFPTGHTPDHTPDLQGKIDRWDIHQFTDRMHMAGMEVDGNYSKLSVGTLFNRASASTGSTSTTRPTTTSTAYTSVVPNASGDGWAFVKPSTAQVVRLQRALGKRGRYKGPANGRFNKDTAKGVQLTIENVGYSGAVDGDIEKNGCHYIQVYAQKFGSYGGPIDNKLGTYTWTGFILGLERP